MKITNTTTIPNDVVRRAIQHARPAGIANFDVMLKNASGRDISGRAYITGSGYHDTASPFIVARVPNETFPVWISKPDCNGKRWKMMESPGRGGNYTRHNRPVYPVMLSPYQYGHLKGKKYFIANRVEHLVYILAHELRHLWQGKSGRRRGMAHGSRGRFSEIDTESYAIRKLREWRKLAPVGVVAAVPVTPADLKAKRAVAAVERRVKAIAAAEASLKRWGTKAKRAKTVITKLERKLKRLRKMSSQ